VAGRYKVFDARVLDAINGALGEYQSVFALNEPKSSIDCRVSCTHEGDFFRLRGHAPFDIVFGYGYAGSSQDPEAVARLGSSLQAALTSAVGQLGWDLQLLQEKRFKPVNNVLFGLRVDYGLEPVAPSPGPSIDIPVQFDGPFSLMEGGPYRSLFADEIAARNGVYIWTVTVQNEERAWYVGQTMRGFGQRTGEHVAGFLSGQYTIFDAEALSRGENRLAPTAITGKWPEALPAFLQNIENLIPEILALIQILHIHVAPLEGVEYLFDRVEGAIGRHYKSHPDPCLRDFLSPGLRLPAAIPFDRPIRLLLSSEVPIAGMPQHIQL
jgi:hypothetical protein